MYIAEYYPVLHPHGKGDEGIAVGIDNEIQISIKLSRKGKRAFVKPYFNQEYDSNRIDEAMETIKESDIICIFGLSLGESDQTWKEALSRWLEYDGNRRIVWYAYELRKINQNNKDEVLDEEERLKHIFLSKLGLDERFDFFEKQICVPIRKSVFKFPSVTELLEKRLEEARELAVT